MQNKLATRCGTIAIIGRPNVGKSTLLNKILGEKLSITSAKPQTTRQQILGIKTQNNVQWIYMDTPGLHQQTTGCWSREIVRDALVALKTADVIGFVVEASRWIAADDAILEQLKTQTQPIILILNKVDRVQDKTGLLPRLKTYSEKMFFAAMIPLSARQGDNVAEFEKTTAEHLPFADFVYPADQLTDRSQDFLAAEFIREKLVQALYKELPYWFTVVIEQFEEHDKLIKINALILTERQGQKAIIIGKKGELLKKVGTEARLDMQRRFGKKVYLTLWVKVSPDWSGEQGI